MKCLCSEIHGVIQITQEHGVHPTQTGQMLLWPKFLTVLTPELLDQLMEFLLCHSHISQQMKPAADFQILLSTILEMMKDTVPIGMMALTWMRSITYINSQFLWMLSMTQLIQSMSHGKVISIESF